MEITRRYTVSGNEFHVPPLTVAQNIELARILRAVGIADGNFSLERFLDAIIENNELANFLATVMVPANGKFERDKIAERAALLGDLPAEQMVEVLEDFFGKNEPWMKRLEDIFRKYFPGMITPAADMMAKP